MHHERHKDGPPPAGALVPPVRPFSQSVWVNTTEVLTEQQAGTRRVKADFVLVWWCVRYWWDLVCQWILVWIFTPEFDVEFAPACAEKFFESLRTVNASDVDRRACSSRAARQICRCVLLASPSWSTCPIATTRYGRSRNSPQPKTNMAAPGAGAAELPNVPALWLSYDSRASSRGSELAVVGSACIRLRQGMKMPRVWRTVVLRATGNEGSSCCVVATSWPLLRPLAHLGWVLQASPAISVSVYLHELYMYLNSWQHFWPVYPYENIPTFQWICW